MPLEHIGMKWHEKVKVATSRQWLSDKISASKIKSTSVCQEMIKILVNGLAR